MPNKGHFWTEAEDEKLIDLYAKKPYGQDRSAFSVEVAPKFGLTINAVKAHLYDLEERKRLKDNFPRVLLFDIETLPLEVYVWGLRRNDYVPPENIIKDWSLSCWSAKWLLEPEIFGAVVTPKEAVARDDERILKPLWKLIDKADVVIGQNSNRFDIKRINTRFLFYGMGDTMPFVSIDTLSASRSKFDFSSFRLDYMNKYLGLDGKKEVTMDDHRACARGDKDALAKMYEYNQWDVAILEEFYMRIRPYIKHPNFAAWSSRVVELDEGEELCPVCRGVVSDNRMTGKWRSPAGYSYKAFRCPHCQAIGRLTVKGGSERIGTKRA